MTITMIMIAMNMLSLIGTWCTSIETERLITFIVYMITIAAFVMRILERNMFSRGMSLTIGSRLIWIRSGVPYALVRSFYRERLHM